MLYRKKNKNILYFHARTRIARTREKSIRTSFSALVFAASAYFAWNEKHMRYKRDYLCGKGTTYVVPYRITGKLLKHQNAQPLVPRERTFISLAQNQLCNVKEAFAAIKAIHNFKAFEIEKPSESNLPRIEPIFVFLYEINCSLRNLSSIS